MQWIWGRITELNDEDYAAVYDELSASRKAHIDKLKCADARKRSLMATKLVRELLEKCGCAKAMLETDADGRPFLRDCDRYVSISHSNDVVACAVSDTPVGIDVEFIKPIEQKLIDYVCTAEERAYVLEGDEKARFFEVWTAKEASYKHDGGTTPLRAIPTLTLDKQTYYIDDYCITIV